MSDYDSLLANASQLPLDARIQLIEALWDTVPDDCTQHSAMSGWQKSNGDPPNTTLAQCNQSRGSKSAHEAMQRLHGAG